MKVKLEKSELDVIKALLNNVEDIEAIVITEEYIQPIRKGDERK